MGFLICLLMSSFACTRCEEELSERGVGGGDVSERPAGWSQDPRVPRVKLHRPHRQLDAALPYWTLCG